jgi:hypothetical protein
VNTPADPRTTAGQPNGTQMVERFDEVDPLDSAELNRLAEVDSQMAVSLYLPTHRRGPEVAQDRIRLGNLLASAERELATLGSPTRETAELLAPVVELLEDSERWRYQSDGLAVFCAPGVFRAFRLPVAFSELAVVAKGFHLRPLLPLAVPDEQFWLLALSQNSVRMFRGTTRSITELDLGATPRSMAEAFENEDPDDERHNRSTGRGSRPQAFGSAGDAEDDKAALDRYFRAVDRGVSELDLDPNVPFVLAGVSYYGPIYRGVSHRRDILEQVVAGSPDDLTAVELHQLAWAVVEPYLSARNPRWQDRLGQSRAEGRTAEGLVDVHTAATEGRVALLILPRDGFAWTNVDHLQPEATHEEREAGDVDLLDDIAHRVLASSGEIVVADNDQLPSDSTLAAVLRY